MEFQLCESGTYLKEKLVENMCEKCEEETECFGGYVPIVPKKGYWRKNSGNYNYAYCYNNPGNCRVNIYYIDIY